MRLFHAQAYSIVNSLSAYGSSNWGKIRRIVLCHEIGMCERTCAIKIRYMACDDVGLERGDYGGPYGRMYAHVYDGLLYMQPTVLQMHAGVGIREWSHVDEAQWC